MSATDTTVSVLGQSVAATTYRRAYERVVELARAGDKAYLVEAANTHVLARARHDRDFRVVMKSFEIVLPDGMPLIWVINRSLKEPLKTRVYGPDFMLKCMEWSCEEADLRHYLFGSSPEVLEKLERTLKERFQGVEIVGRFSPPFREWTEAENTEFVEQIRQSGANLIWIGLGCPKQERWLAGVKGKLPPGVYFGIGAAFPLNAGLIRQAPDWLQARGLEWLFRLLIEPARLWKRYLKYNTLFIYYLIRDRLLPDSRGAAGKVGGATAAPPSGD